MRRLHFYIMGLISLGYGALTMAEYLLVSLGGALGWLDMYPPEQIAWLETLPTWVHGVWGLHATLALVGALCLLAHLRPAVWMLAFAFLTLLVVLGWALGFAEPSLPDLVGLGAPVFTIAALVVVLNFLIYLYARQEKQAGEVL